MAKAPDFSFKVIVVGPPGVGKTSLVKKFVERKFQEDYLPTAGANVMATYTTAKVACEEYWVNLAIWDLAAQDSFKTMRQSFYAGAKGAFFVADLTRVDSLEDLVNWNLELRNALPRIPRILLANKCDLKHAVKAQYLKDLSVKVHASEVLKTSALNGENVIAAFQSMACKIIENLMEKKETSRSKKEIRLKKAVQYIYVLSRVGLVLYEQTLSPEDAGSVTDGSLIGGALVAISDLLKEIAKNAKPLKVVRQEGFSILVEEGEQLLVALVASEDSKPLREKIVAFLGDLHTSLGAKLQAYLKKGQVIPSAHVGPLVAKHFS